MITIKLPDMTPEENTFLDLVKKRMLTKLDDRKKFIFLYVFEMGHQKHEAAEVLGVDNSIITRQIKRIRSLLSSFKNI